MKTQKTIGTVKMFSILWSVLMFFTVLLAAQQAGAAVIFEDNFDSPTLAPEWSISPGRGSYSLTANPGYLRFIIDAWNGYLPSLLLDRPFSGDQWTLKTAITYNIRPAEPTNNRVMNLLIKTPGEGTNFTINAQISRWGGDNDGNPASNMMCISAGSNAQCIYFPNSPNPLPIERWYFEIERNKNYVVVRASTDGNDSTFEYEYEGEYTFPSGLGNDQVIELSNGGWWGSNNPPGYADFDFIRVVPEPATICLLCLGGLALLKRR